MKMKKKKEQKLSTDSLIISLNPTFTHCELNNFRDLYIVHVRRLKVSGFKYKMSVGCVIRSIRNGLSMASTSLEN